MRPLNFWQNVLFRCGGVLMLAALLLSVVYDGVTQWGTVAFAVGAVLFGGMQFLTRYEGRDTTLRHLRRQQIAGAVFLFLAALLLVGKTFGIGPLRADEWKLALAVAAVFEVYTAFRIPYELKRKGDC